MKVPDSLWDIEPKPEPTIITQTATTVEAATVEASTVEATTVEATTRYRGLDILSNKTASVVSANSFTPPKVTSSIRCGLMNPMQAVSADAQLFDPANRERITGVS